MNYIGGDRRSQKSDWSQIAKLSIRIYMQKEHMIIDRDDVILYYGDK